MSPISFKKGQVYDIPGVNPHTFTIMGIDDRNVFSIEAYIDWETGEWISSTLLSDPILYLADYLIDRKAKLNIAKTLKNLAKEHEI